MRFFLRFSGIIMLLLSISARAKVEPARYGIYNFPDEAAIQQMTMEMTDDFLATHSMLAGKNVISDIAMPHEMESQTADFYLLLFLCFMLGVIRFIDRRYFMNLWRAFWNPTLSNRQLKDQLQGAGLPNLLMNVFFAFAGGAYLYYVVRFYTPHRTGAIPSALLVLMLVAGTGLIYLSKYAAVRFSGWAFRVEGITEHYLFNVFLINKVLGIMLIPFIVVLAFADHNWAQQVVVVSFIISGILLLNRYVRSWEVFGSFFQYSKFHFFVYLCASELLPLAVLLKLLVKGLMF